jgi:hypothetical protein
METITMHNYKKNENNNAPDASDFLGGNYLRKEDVTGASNVTIEAVRSVEVTNAEGNKLVVWFQELAKPLILNKTNTRKLVEIFQSTDTATWRGKITLFFDGNVYFGGKQVGGIRFRAAILSQAKDVRPAAPARMPMANGHHLDDYEAEQELDSHSIR